jgi:hypothetical protein
MTNELASGIRQKPIRLSVGLSGRHERFPGKADFDEVP